jgi:hypothetical protein
MSWMAITQKEYSDFFKGNYLSVFESVPFIETNKSRADEILYLVYKDSKLRFGAIGGVCGKELRLPFSAPYSNLSIVSENRIELYHQAIKELVGYVKELGLESILFTLPPMFYSRSHITKLSHALNLNTFKMKIHDLNHHFDLTGFSEDSYISSLDTKSRQKLKAGIANGLVFEETKDIDTAYEVIKINRVEKGYPLKMTLAQLKETMAQLSGYLFLVKDLEGKPVASAIVYNTSKDNCQIIYWGNVTSTDHLKPMNFLAFKVFSFFSSKKKKYIDIGPSSDQSVPNFGLCDFKESIGCQITDKFTYSKDLTWQES